MEEGGGIGRLLRKRVSIKSTEAQGICPEGIQMVERRSERQHRSIGDKEKVWAD